ADRTQQSEQSLRKRYQSPSDGGQKYESSIAWLDEGLSRVNQIRRGAIECSDWSRDSWGVELRNGMARIYSLYDEDCSAAIALDDFERALLGWKRFIQAD
ncbi:hypothetical protein AAIH53_33395, partial [Pseudomonas aeruginosa]